MELEKTKEANYKLIIPFLKRDIKGDLGSFKNYIPSMEYFYFETLEDAEKHLSLLNSRAFIVGC